MEIKDRLILGIACGLRVTRPTCPFSLYGILSTMGAILTEPLSSKTVLSEIVGHAVFGATAAFTAAKLGDPTLFPGDKQLTAPPLKSSIRSNA